VTARRPLAAALLFAVAVGTVPTLGSASAASLPSPGCIARTTPVPNGPAHLVSDKRLAGHGGRLHELTLRSPAMAGDVKVNVLLPERYSAHPSHRYHVLYLLHGSGGSQVDWAEHGAQKLIDTAAARAHLPATITVMPDGGLEGYYSDWYGTDLLNPAERIAPAWATYDIDELIPYIDSHYPTIASRRGRAIAGLSMGGFGATSLAARNPGLFSAVGSFSGADDIDLNNPYEAIVLEGTSPAFTLGAPTLCIWGDPVTHQIGFEAADPTYLAPDLADTRLYLASGNGTPGPLDGTGPANLVAAEGAGVVELDVSQMNAAFVASLNASHVAHTDYFYGAGTHAWPYWERDLTHFVPIMAGAWRHPDAQPGSFSDRSAADSFQAWGWQFTAHRSVEEFTYLRNVSKQGFQVAGSGTLHVVTAADYRPGSHWRVAGHAATAGPDGRLHFTVQMPAHSAQQTSFPAGSAIPSGWHWIAIGIRAATAKR
jgi:S-formylglutathione hydrolase FrmB